MDNLAYGGITVVIGSLTGTPILTNAVDFLFNDKSLRSYLIFPWYANLDPIRKGKVEKEVADDMARGGEIFGTTFTQTLPLEEWQDALKLYKEIASRDGGKILLKCNP